MKRSSVSAFGFVVAASLAGCGATGEVEYAGEVQVTSPELVTISPGVQVVADADEPLFYSDGFYWLYRDSYWYRSDSYRGGFARIDFVMVPSGIRTIERPQVYTQYRRHAGRDQWAREQHPQQRSPQLNQPTYPYTRPTYEAPRYQDPAPNTTTPVTPYQPGAAHPSPQPEGINPTQPPAIAPVVPPRHTPPGQNVRHDDHGNGNTDRDDRKGGNATTNHDDRNGPDNPSTNVPPGQNRGDKNGQNPGNPSAPNRVAPTSPSNAPTTPNPPGTAKSADKDQHDHGNADKKNEKNDKDNKAKKKNEKY